MTQCWWWDQIVNWNSILPDSLNLPIGNVDYQCDCMYFYRIPLISDCNRLHNILLVLDAMQCSIIPHHDHFQSPVLWIPWDHCTSIDWWQHNDTTIDRIVPIPIIHPNWIVSSQIHWVQHIHNSLLSIYIVI